MLLNHVRRLRRAEGQSGTALIEFQLVLLACLLPLLLGGLQLLLLEFGGRVLDHATYRAARQGAMTGADPQAMASALAVGLMPLHLDATVQAAAGSAGTALVAARARAVADAALFAEIRILAPSQAAFDDHATWVDGKRVIRNDSLETRPTTPGPRSGLSLQLANLLQIEARYCHRLIVPFADAWLLGLLRWTDTDLDSQLCYAAGRVPLRSRVTVNAQADLAFHGD
ncbi:MAG: hypothetical protein RL026_2240 [Pseudomonadota bacterium]|jgi:hypothetical protein